MGWGWRFSGLDGSVLGVIVVLLGLRMDCLIGSASMRLGVSEVARVGLLEVGLGHGGGRGIE